MMPVPNSKHEESRALGAVADSGLIQLSEGDIFILPPSFVPGKWDVICQRGKECFEHVGNRRFRITIDNYLDKYMDVKSRQQKSKIVTMIVEGIKKSAGQDGGGFVRKDLLTRRWFRVSDKLAREKVGQALRDAIKTRRASTKKAKSGGNCPPATKPTFNSHSSEAKKQELLRSDSELSNSRVLEHTISSYSQDLQQQQILSSSPAPLSHPSSDSSSSGMPLVPFVDSQRSLGDFEPRPLSFPVKLGDYFFNTLSDPHAQHRNTAPNNTNVWTNNDRGQHDANATMNASLSNILAGQNTNNACNIAALLPGMNNANILFQSNLNSNHSSSSNNSSNPLSHTQPQQSHLPTAYANAGLAQLFGSLDGASGDIDFSIPSTTQQQSQQQMLSSLFGARVGMDPLHNLPSQQQQESGDYSNGVAGALPNSLLGSTIQPLDIAAATLGAYSRPPTSPQQEGKLDDSPGQQQAHSESFHNSKP